MVVFGHERWKRYPRGGLVVLWDPSYCLAFYYGYLGSTYGFCSADVICGNRKVTVLIILGVFLRVYVDGHPISC